MLHSIGCSQPSAQVLINSWNSPSYNSACVHAFIDANTGDVYQTLPWEHRGWHCGSGSNGSANNTHIGAEMCEPACIKYTSGAIFICSDLSAARTAATRTYNAAVELFAMLCEKYDLDPLADGVILSHKEGHQRGIASNHGDPEHLWTQLGLSYTMDSFRAAVYRAILNAHPERNNTASVKAAQASRYNTVGDMPEWAKPTIIKLVDAHRLNGGGSAHDSDGRPADLDLSLDMLRLLVINDRAGLYGT